MERRAILLWTLNALLSTAVFLAALGLAHRLLEPARPWLGPIWIVMAVASAVKVTLMPTMRYLIHRWESTDRAVYALQGWVVRQWRITPVSRIQSIDTVKGPLHQLLGLATLRVTTASKEGGITIRGLDAAVAAEAARRLTEITQNTPGDAT